MGHIISTHIGLGEIGSSTGGGSSSAKVVDMACVKYDGDQALLFTYDDEAQRIKKLDGTFVENGDIDLSLLDCSCDTDASSEEVPLGYIGYCLAEETMPTGSPERRTQVNSDDYSNLEIYPAGSSDCDSQPADFDNDIFGTPLFLQDACSERDASGNIISRQTFGPKIPFVIVYTQGANIVSFDYTNGADTWVMPLTAADKALIEAQFTPLGSGAFSLNKYEIDSVLKGRVRVYNPLGWQTVGSGTQYLQALGFPTITKYAGTAWEERFDEGAQLVICDATIEQTGGSCPGATHTNSTEEFIVPKGIKRLKSVPIRSRTSNTLQQNRQTESINNVGAPSDGQQGSGGVIQTGTLWHEVQGISPGTIDWGDGNGLQPWAGGAVPNIPMPDGDYHVKMIVTRNNGDVSETGALVELPYTQANGASFVKKVSQSFFGFSLPVFDTFIQFRVVHFAAGQSRFTSASFNLDIRRRSDNNIRLAGMLPAGNITGSGINNFDRTYAPATIKIDEAYDLFFESVYTGWPDTVENRKVDTIAETF